jgi:RNA polymerase sigma-70 factor (ECF subfamily)
LEKLCRAYWYPLYAYVRRDGHSTHKAEDLTQAFFERLLDKNFLANVRPEHGRFRAFLLTALKHFIVNEWHAGQAQKRGGGCRIVSFDDPNSELRYEVESADHLTPELLFHKRWALTVVQRVMAKLEAEFRDEKKADLFDDLKGFLVEKKATSHAKIAARHDISVNSVGVTICRLRKRYAELLREEIAETVKDPAEINDEIRFLIKALGY